MSKSSKSWKREHFNDEYVKRAKAEGWRSRAAFKLLEIQEKDKLIKPGMTVVDLGAAPGGWSQVCAKILKGEGRLLALDILPMDPIGGVEFIQGDFSLDETYEKLKKCVENEHVDLVISDIAPNTSGIKEVDQPKSMFLAELALDFAEKVLAPQGKFLVKVFQGQGFVEILAQMRQNFTKVVVRKPKSSRSRSKEVYLLGTGYNNSRS